MFGCRLNGGPSDGDRLVLACESHPVACGVRVNAAASAASWASVRATGGLGEQHPAVADLRWWHQIRHGNPGERGVQRADLHGGRTHPDTTGLPGRSNAIAVEFAPSGSTFA